MQPCTRNGSSEPGPPGTLGSHPPDARLGYGGRWLHRRNENGMLALVERHRDEMSRKAALPRAVARGRP